MRKENDWLKKEIAKGFMLLSALNLKGRPAAKDSLVQREVANEMSRRD